MNRRHIFVGVILLLSAGCSTFPGLRVLTGETTADGLVAESVEVADLVMADKSTVGDPSLLAAADRIEAASGFVDIIEIRRLDDEDAFVVNLVIQDAILPTDINTQIRFLDILRRFVELSWQGTLQESEGSGVLKVNVYVARTVASLNSGDSLIGFLLITTEIDREDALVYLSHRPNTLDDFAGLVVDGILQYDEPAGSVIYDGEPNHPMFMLAQPSALEGQ
jgi:hypothetical protein